MNCFCTLKEKVNAFKESYFYTSSSTAYAKISNATIMVTHFCFKNTVGNVFTWNAQTNIDLALKRLR